MSPTTMTCKTSANRVLLVFLYIDILYNLWTRFFIYVLLKIHGQDLYLCAF
jgi:hypothetical protein